MQRSLLFYWALFFFFGTCFALHPHLAYCIPVIVFSFLCKRKVQCLAFLLMGFAFASIRTEPPETGNVRGVFTLTSIAPTQSPFARSLALKGHLQTRSHNTPCVIFQNTLPSGSKWILEGHLNDGILKPKKDFPWIELKDSFSLVRFRFALKEAVRHHFHKKKTKASSFFASMATGDSDDRLLAMEFRKLGLGHILAISGFHFALLAGMLGALFRLLLPHKVAYILLLIFLTTYFLYLGYSPSILRAYTMIALFILGRLLQRPIDVLNLLGAALLIELTLDPQTITQVSFQLRNAVATLGFFNRDQDLFADLQSILDRFESRGERLPLIVAKIRVARANSNDEIVIREDIAIAKRNGAGIFVDFDNIAHHDRSVFLVAENLANWRADFSRG